MAPRLCPDCHAPLPANSPPGAPCPACLVRVGLDESLAAGESSASAGSSAALLPRDFFTGEPLALNELGDYELLEQIGRGGMGVIYRARQRSLNRTVAVKLIRGGALARTPSVARFRTEAAAAARLQHPGIVANHHPTPAASSGAGSGSALRARRARPSRLTLLWSTLWLGPQMGAISPRRATMARRCFGMRHRNECCVPFKNRKSPAGCRPVVGLKGRT